MNKKTGLVLAASVVILAICCSGMFFLLNSAAQTAKRLMQSGAGFAKTVAEDVGKDFKFETLASHSLESINQPDQKKKVSKSLADYAAKIGPLKTLGEVTLLKLDANINQDPSRNLEFNFLAKNAQFEKGPGQIGIDVVLIKKAWKVKGFTVYSKALGNENEAPKTDNQNSVKVEPNTEPMQLPE